MAWVVNRLNSEYYCVICSIKKSQRWAKKEGLSFHIKNRHTKKEMIAALSRHYMIYS